jgi:hypothetical protein
MKNLNSRMRIVAELSRARLLYAGTNRSSHTLEMAAESLVSMVAAAAAAAAETLLE